MAVVVLGFLWSGLMLVVIIFTLLVLGTFSRQGVNLRCLERNTENREADQTKFGDPEYSHR